VRFHRTAFSLLFIAVAGCATGVATEPGSDPGASDEAATADLTIRPFDHCDTGKPCPDLALDVPKLKASIYIETRDIDPRSCSVNEGEIGAAGERRLLRFTTGAKNAGTGDLFLGDPAHGDPKYFEFAQCHGHYHFKGFADYQLLKLDHSLVVQGHKMSFCVEDNEPPTNPHEGTTNLIPRPDEVPQGSPPPVDHWTPSQRTYCHHPGLHRGWEDAYANTIEGNWLDITDVAPGDYLLSITLNPQHFIAELSYDNNHTEVKIHVPPKSADGNVCPPNLEAIFRCQQDGTRKKCLKGVTSVATCDHGTTCKQPEETAHPGKCFANSVLSSAMPGASAPLPGPSAPWTAGGMDDVAAIEEPGDPSLLAE
jgi:hypothetical protein